jgi:signal transduction histidine kinase/CheY-like chemotaxis protein
MKYFTLFLILLTFLKTSFVFSQSKLDNKIDSINRTIKNLDVQKIVDLRHRLEKEKHVIPMDSTYFRSHRILSLIGDIEDKDDKYYKWRIWGYGDTVNDLMVVHMAKGNLDSVQYYGDLAKKYVVDKATLGVTYQFLSRLDIYKSNYYQSLINKDKALECFKESNAFAKETGVLMELANFYDNTNAKESLKDILIILNKRKDNPKVKYNKGMIELLNCSLITNTDKKVKSLEKIDATSLNWNRYLKLLYDETLADAYLANGNFDLALETINKAYHGLENQKSYDLAKTVKLIRLFLVKKEYAKAEKYIEKSNRIMLDSGIFDFEIDNLEFNYQINEHNKNWKQAFEAKNKYDILKDSLYLVKEKQLSAILRYKLIKDQELVELEAENKEKEYLASQEKQSLLYISLLIIIVLISVALIVYFYLRRKNLKTKIALQHANEITELKNNFIENLSHEFRTPLSIISGYINLIKTNVLNPNKIKYYTDVALRNGEELIAILNDFLYILKSEGKQNIKPHKNIRKGNLRLIIYQVVESFLAKAHPFNIKLYFKTNIKENGSDIEFDYDNLKIILNNLISNAIKFSELGNAIYITVNLEKEALFLKVQDEGIGIPQKEKEKVFDRFYQTGEINMQGGFGIGLALVKDIVVKWGGEIKLKSKENIGSIFEISLPSKIDNFEFYLFDKEKDFELIKIYVDKNVEVSNVKNLPKALIIEDNIDMGLYLSEILNTVVNTTLASNGSDALTLVKEKDFDIIISDLRMPIMNGFEFKNEFNKIEKYAQTPFLLMSASSVDYKMKERTVFGIDEYIIKPFSDIEIISRIKLLIQPNIYRKNIFEVENKSLDVSDNSYIIMGKINEIIIKNLKNPDFNVRKLAEMCNYSESKLYKLVQSKTGIPPVKVILEVRLLRAYELIKYSDFDTLTEIMYEVGVSSPSYFRKVFLERFGIKPGDLMKKNKFSA